MPLPTKAKRKKKRSKRGKKTVLSGEDGGNDDLGAQEKKTGSKKTKKNSKSGEYLKSSISLSHRSLK